MGRIGDSSHVESSYRVSVPVRCARLRRHWLSVRRAQPPDPELHYAARHPARAGLICGVLFLIFWLAGGMGAGDVKLMTAVAAIAGMPLVPWLLILTALAGGVMALGLAVWRGRLRETIRNVGALALHHRIEGLAPHPQLNLANARTLRLPYALAVAAGTATTLFLTAFQR